MSKYIKIIFILSFLVLILSLIYRSFFVSKTFYLNTSNPNKMAEFRRLFDQYGVKLETSEIDLKEIIGTPEQVITHKASQLNKNVLVEDTSLDIDGEDVGINIRWLLDNLPKHINKKATWTVLLAYRSDDGMVHIYQGQVEGIIVSPKGKGFGFDPFFKPKSSQKTLAESKPDQFNARSIAVDNLMKKIQLKSLPPIIEWDGPWQH